MGANGRGEHHSPSSAKTSPRGAAGGGGGEQYSSAAKSPRAGGGGGGEHYSSSSKSPRAGICGGVSSLLPSGAVASLLESRWAISAALTVFLFLAVTLTVTSSSSSSLSPVSASFFSFLPAGRADYVEPKVQQQQQQPQAPATPPPPPLGAGVPRLAYLISGSKGDLDRLWRALHALYHPRNLYVVHLDREAPVGERLELAARVANSTVFRRVGNVEVIRRANMVTYRGPTMVANTLHACAVLLRRSRDWDWFINLSASDYPLMSQDDVLHVFSTLPRNVNFIEHTSRLGWKEGQRAQPLIVDPGLYASQKQDIFYAATRRELPTAFRLYTGSAWVALTRDFAEYVVWGWDNLPRTLLMYYANFVSSPEGYFQTVLCNAPRFVPTVANHDLHHIQWDVPPRQHPHALTLGDMDRMVRSDAPFARKFARDDPVLDAIDAQLLGGRGGGNGTAAAGMFVRGGWCGEQGDCVGAAGADDWVLRPGPGAERLRRLMDRIVRSEAFANRQCK
ncbi:beta-glucuronosyltransferase GlcAT14B-like [Hordeum vulgare]|uniref:BGGP Beta-1-3-galactosyl-O-glycosyl-glycoprotein n=1 Tax=Hordeum vulgare subsp. vulgare TaxID=112509 RepID=A0A8I6XCB3_HORVV|nr:beta-glucuronosyltransferase GlcAT14B-like [Hordeum vulgare subsp. vulgare]KAE8770609.1 beta-glucuronosyltransferase GlcAT14B-like [Hordeum vulgare]